MSIELLFLLLLGFQLKHFLADYSLQFEYMYENKGRLSGWIKPLAHHSLVHATFTFFISVGFVGISIALALGAFDFITHFLTDRWKARKPEKCNQDNSFWINLGIDQMVHHTVGIIITYLIYTNTLS